MIGLVSLIGGLLFRVWKGESALETARKAQDTADRALAELNAFKEHAASTYASQAMLDKMEGRVVDAINRLGDRLDNLFQPRPAPRTRATKDRS